MDTDRFDVIAKAETDIPRPVAGGPPGPFHFMLRALLAERFKLAVHQEKRELPIYELHLARADGTLGPGLRRSDFDCSTAEKMPDGRCALGMTPPILWNDSVARNSLRTQYFFPFGEVIKETCIGQCGPHKSTRPCDVDVAWWSDLQTLEAIIFTRTGTAGISSFLTWPSRSVVVDRDERPTPDEQNRHDPASSRRIR